MQVCVSVIKLERNSISTSKFRKVEKCSLTLALFDAIILLLHGGFLKILAGDNVRRTFFDVCKNMAVPYYNLYISHVNIRTVLTHVCTRMYLRGYSKF